MCSVSIYFHRFFGNNSLILLNFFWKISKLFARQSFGKRMPFFWGGGGGGILDNVFCIHIFSQIFWE